MPYAPSGSNMNVRRRRRRRFHDSFKILFKAFEENL
jgi:hypothetical protein